MSIIDTGTKVYELAMKGATLELREQLLKLREEASALQEENLALKKSIKELKDAQDLKDSLTFDGKVYWKLLPDGGKDGPYCQKCYDVDGLLVHLISEAVTYKGRQQNRLECKACNSGRIFAAK